MRLAEKLDWKGLMMYKVKVAVRSQIRTKHSTQIEHHVEFELLNLVVSKETARL
jgi:hypothetical protein